MDDDFEMDEAELERMEEEMMAEQAADRGEPERRPPRGGALSCGRRRRRTSPRGPSPSSGCPSTCTRAIPYQVIREAARAGRQQETVPHAGRLYGSTEEGQSVCAHCHGLHAVLFRASAA